MDKNEVPDKSSSFLDRAEDGFLIFSSVEKGRGILSLKDIPKDEFVLEYKGELIEKAEGIRREQLYSGNLSFLFFLTFKGKDLCIDATKETGCFGRLVNHSLRGNLKRKLLDVYGQPRLCLFAKKFVRAGEELLYDYGDKRKCAMLGSPWLKCIEPPISMFACGVRLDSSANLQHHQVNNISTLHISPAKNLPESLCQLLVSEQDKISVDKINKVSPDLRDRNCCTSQPTTSGDAFSSLKSCIFPHRSPDVAENDDDDVVIGTLSSCDIFESSYSDNSSDEDKSTDVPEELNPIQCKTTFQCLPVHHHSLSQDINKSNEKTTCQLPFTDDVLNLFVESDLFSDVSFLGDQGKSLKRESRFMLNSQKMDKETVLQSLLKKTASKPAADVRTVSSSQPPEKENDTVSDFQVSKSLQQRVRANESTKDPLVSLKWRQPQLLQLSVAHDPTENVLELHAERCDSVSPSTDTPSLPMVAVDKGAPSCKVVISRENDIDLEEPKRNAINRTTEALESAQPDAIVKTSLSGSKPYVVSENAECADLNIKKPFNLEKKPAANNTKRFLCNVPLSPIKRFSGYENGTERNALASGHDLDVPLYQDAAERHEKVEINAEDTYSTERLQPTNSRKPSMSAIVLDKSAVLLPALQDNPHSSSEPGTVCKKYQLREKRSQPVVLQGSDTSESDDEDLMLESESSSYGEESSDSESCSDEELSTNKAVPTHCIPHNSKPFTPEKSSDSVVQECALDHSSLSTNPRSSQQPANKEKNGSSHTISPVAANSGLQNSEVRRVPVECSQMNEPSSESVAAENFLFVMPKKTQKILANKRDWSKRAACLFCGKLVIKLPDHLQRQHAELLPVKEAFQLPLNSQERRIAFGALRSKGNLLHNSKIIQEQKGQIIPKRISSFPAQVENLLPCVFCGDYFSSQNLHKHKKRCQQRSSFAPDEREDATGSAFFLLSSKPTDVHREVLRTEILGKLRKSAESTKVINSDSTILKFGLRLVEKFAGRPDLYDHVRCKLREIGKFLLELRKLNTSILSLADAIRPMYFDVCVDAALQISGYDAETNTFKIPSLCKRVGESLLKCANICYRTALVNENEKKEKEVKSFINLHALEWSLRVSAKATAYLKEAKFNKPTQLPDKEDVLRVASYIDKHSELAFNNLNEDKSNSVLFTKLANVTLASVILFNRKRPGDAHRLWVQRYMDADIEKPHDDIWNSLSDREKELVSTLKRVETRGKKGMKVPILFTHRMQRNVQLLLDCRELCSVPTENIYLFARPGTSTFLRGSDAIRHIRSDAHCVNPERVTATCLRKEAAVLAKISGLEELSVEDLAQFLGHDIQTHRQHYRLPERTLQTARVSQYLMKISHVDTAASDAEDTGSSSDSEEIDGAVAKGPEPVNEARTVKKKQSQPKKKKTVAKKCQSNVQDKRFTKNMWSDAQKAAVMKHLGSQILLKKIPGKSDCEKALRESPLKTRRWTDVKNFCRNEITKILRQARLQL